MKRTRSYLTILVFLTCIILFVSTAHAEEGLTGRIDWINGYIIGYGIGSAEPGMNKAIARASSIRAAKVDGLRNLLETIKGVHIDSRTVVEDFMTKQDVISARVDGIIKGAQMVSHKTEWMEASPLTTVEMRVCISATAQGCSPGKSLVSALDLSKFKGVEQIPSREFSGSSAPVAPESEKVDFHYDSSKPVTGVVLSLKGYYYKRVVLPVISAKKGNDLETVYSVRHVKPKTVRTYGIVRFVDALDQVETIKSIGKNYMVVPVENVTDTNMILISSGSAQKIYETTRHGNDYLEKAAVVICAE